MRNKINLDKLTNGQKDRLVIQLQEELDVRIAANNELVIRLRSVAATLPADMGERLVDIVNQWSQVHNEIGQAAWANELEIVASAPAPGSVN